MDQTLSLSHQSTPASPGPAQAAGASPLAASLDEEPESPGRSPRPSAASAAGNDPLAEGLAVVGGVLLALLTLLVPVVSVIAESPPGVPGPSVRAGR